MTDTAPPAPAWYPDPAGSGQYRWWDGGSWTDHFRDASAPDAGAPVEVGPQTRLDTVFAWGIVAVVAISLLISVFTGAAAVSVRSPLSGAYWASLLPGIIAYALIVVLAFYDWRGLRTVGVQRPFHWAWAFLGQIVYIIGRSVVVYRRTGRGLLVLWVWLGLEVLSIIVGAVQVATLMPSLTSGTTIGS